jgi:phenylpyruvate tautomerase PptA (4-oxalocrotonate tautomerase family)
MPLVQVDLPRSVFSSHAKAMGIEIQQAFIETLATNPTDKFQVFRPRDEGELVFDPTYGNVDRRSWILIQILMVHRHPVDHKRKLYRAIVTRLEALGIRREDIQIAVTENGFEDWYAGRLYGE